MNIYSFLQIIQVILEPDCMKKQGGISGAKISKMFYRFEEINLVGSGVLTYQEKYGISQQYDAAYVICSLDEAKIIDIQALGELTRAIAIKIDSTCLISEAAFEAYYLQRVQPVINQTPAHKRLLKFFLIDWHKDMNHSVLKTILLTLQLMSHFAIIRPIINPTNWLEYQTQLFNFTHHVLQTDSLILSTVSVILKLPELQSPDYSKQLLSIWKRVLPAALGRLVIQDWTDCKLCNPISRLFYIKNLAMSWQLQFLTSYLERYETLSEQTLGLV